MAPNRLARENSPYLLQHADNPVDWRPWGDEAFAAARAADRPIFLSIGYATCHWCHVMAHESFEDPEVAALLNDAFVCVKVDREERPDVDQVYMTVCQLVTGSGGWPLTVVMTPDGRPFYAGTYIPKHGRWGRPGLMELLPQITSLWSTDRVRLEQSAAEITGHLAAAARPRVASVGGAELDAAVRDLTRRFDSEHGGFGGAPKFPSPQNLLLLLRHWRRHGDADTLAMVEATLDAMWCGGIHDHVGGGFHRYSTDREWLVPHFEKMLYDQAMLLLAATEAYRATAAPRHAAMVRDIVGYLERDLSAPDGGIRSAEDADSEGEEGRFYLWTRAELEDALGPEDGALAAAVWGATEAGNYHDEASGRPTGRNILHLSRPLAAVAAEHGVTEEELARRVDTMRARLLDVRSGRPRPLLDDKVLADWNGLAAAALARAGKVLGEPEWIARAALVTAFVDANMRAGDGGLLHRFRAGEAAVPGFLDDYAAQALASLELYDATLEAAHLRRAGELAEAMIESFWDAAEGGFFLTAAGTDELLVRPKDGYDGAAPSGNSLAAMVLVRLARLTGRAELEERARSALAAFGEQIRQAPAGFGFALAALDEASAPSTQLVIAGDPDAADTRALVAVARRHAPPGTALLLVADGPAGSEVRRLAPFAADHTAAGGRATAYLCRDFSCDLPTTEPEVLRQRLVTPADA